MCCLVTRRTPLYLVFMILQAIEGRTELSLARQHFYWPLMEKNIKEYVKWCQRCVLESIKSPMEMVCIDFWSAEDGKHCSVDVLVVTGHFTKLTHAFPCTKQTAKQVAISFRTMCFVSMGSQKEYSLARAPILRAASQLVVLQNLTQQPTTRWVMVALTTFIEPWVA